MKSLLAQISKMIKTHNTIIPAIATVSTVSIMNKSINDVNINPTKNARINSKAPISKDRREWQL